MAEQTAVIDIDKTAQSTSAQSKSAASGVSGSSAGAPTVGSGKASGGRGAGAKAVPVAAVSFVCGLVGLLVANLVLGPLAIVLGLIGLRVDSSRRARAALGILLGVADIAVFVLLAAHAGGHHGSLSWNFLSR